MSATTATITGDVLLLTPPEAAAALGVTTQQLEADRVAGQGPAWFEVGARTVRYFRSSVLEAVSTR